MPILQLSKEEKEGQAAKEVEFSSSFGKINESARNLPNTVGYPIS